MLPGMKKRSAHQTPRRKKGFFKGVGYTDQHIWKQRNVFIGIKLVHFTLPATAMHERAGYNWPPARRAYAPEGMLEYWNTGILGSGKMVSWVIVKFLLRKLNRKMSSFLNHHSIIPSFHYSMCELKI